MIRLSRKNLNKVFNTRNVLIALILLLLLIMFGKYVTAVLVTLLFIPIGIATTRYGKMVPHVSPETITISSVFMSYVYGVKIGVIFALGVGIYCYMKNSMISLPYLTVVLLAALSAVVVNFTKQFFDFSGALAAAVLVRNLVGLPLYMTLISPNPPENIIHHTTHTFLNALIYTPILKTLYDLLSFF